MLDFDASTVSLLEGRAGTPVNRERRWSLLPRP